MIWLIYDLRRVSLTIKSSVNHEVQHQVLYSLYFYIKLIQKNFNKYIFYTVVPKY